MQSLDHAQITTFFLALGILLATARLLGEIARRLRQPAVLGEILAGILLGPTVLGHLWPEANTFLFPATGPNALALTTLASLAVALFLLVAGLEVDLSMLFRLKKTATVIGLSSLVLPFAIGMGLGQITPDFVGMEPGADTLVFSLFLGVALSISALPVIAKTLMDLNLFRSDLGMIIIAVAIFHDIVGWIIFAMILGMMQSGASGASGGEASIAFTIALTLGFAAFMLTLGRSLIHRALPWLQAHTSWPGGVLGFTLSLGLLGAAFTEWIGIHAIFGAFLVGVALGDSSHLRQQTRATLEQFIGFIFAPLFFASIGLRVDFVAHFDLALVLTVLAIACVGMTFGGMIGSRWSGLPKRQSWAIGFALNARGAMEIVLALLALQYGVIGERLFVALVVMALVTSLIAGPMMQAILRRKHPERFLTYLTNKTFLPPATATHPRAVIETLTAALQTLTDRPLAALTEAVWNREQTMSTGLPGGLAVPHARIDGLNHPLVAAALLRHGVDWDAADGQPTHLAVLVLTPEGADETQLELLADLAATFQTPGLVDRAAACATYTEFVALLNSESSAHRSHT